MNNYVKSIIDSIDIDGWGFSPVPPLPGSLRTYWADTHLPSWCAEDMKLPELATYKDLSSDVWLKLDRLPLRCRGLIIRRLKRESSEIAQLRAIQREWPYILEPSDVPWPPRVWNALIRGRLVGRLPEVGTISFEELFRIPSFGPKGILEFTCILEKVLDRIEKPVSAAGLSGTIPVPQQLQMLLHAPIEELTELSVRARNSLNKENIPTLGDLVQRSELEMVKIENFGKKSLNEIHTFLENNDLRFGMQFEKGEHGELLLVLQMDGAGHKIDSEQGTQSTPVDLESELLRVSDLPWVGTISKRDARFAGLLPPELSPNLTLLDHVEEILADSIGLNPSSIDDPQRWTFETTNAWNIKVLLEAVPAISTRVDEIQKLQLEEALEDFFGKSNPRMQRFNEVFHALRDRFGWGDVAWKTLEEVGQALGVTRERARQLEAKFVECIPDHETWMPALDRALRALESYAPIPSSEASSRLVKDGICARAFTPQGVLKAADLFGLEHTVSLVEEGDSFLVISIESSGDIPLINQIAKKQANASGASTVLELDAELRSHDLEMDIEELRETVRSLPDMTFVQGDWFVYFDGQGSPTVSVAQKMLSVTAPLTARTIRAGLHRQMRFRKTRGNSGWPLILIPTPVVQYVLENNENFVSDPDSGFRLSSPIDYTEVLRGTEAGLISILRSSPSGVWERSDILEEAERRGLNTTTVSVYLTYSPVIGHLGVDLWTVCGAHVAPEAVEALRKAKSHRSRTKRTLGHTWTQEGNLAIAYRIPDNWQPSNVLGIPSDVTRFLTHKEYPAFTKSGAPVGRLRIYSKAGNLVFGGYSKFLNNVSGEAGDVLIVEFKTIEGSAELRLESPEVFDAPEFST